jgi:hypothetical protein
MKTYPMSSLRRQRTRPNDYLYPLIESGELFTQAQRQDVHSHPGFLHEQMACINIGLVARTETRARAWLRRILARCESAVATEPSCLESLTFHAFGWEDAVPEGMRFHEIHVLDADELPPERCDYFRSQADLLSLHLRGSEPPLSNLNLKCFSWPDGEEPTTHFLANLFSILAERELMSLDWATYASLFPGGRRCWTKHGEGQLTAAILSNLGTASTPSSPKPISSAFLLIEYGETFSLGDYAEASDWLASQLPMDGQTYIALRYVPASDVIRYWLLLSDDLGSFEPR